MAEKTSPFLHLNAAPPTPGKRLSRKLGIVIALVLLAILAASIVWRVAHQGLLMDAVVGGQAADVIAPANGQIVEVRVTEDQPVNAGQPLFVLDVSAFASGKDAADQARLKGLADQVKAAEKAEEEARAALRQASQAHARALLALRGLGQPGNDTTAQQRYAQAQSEEIAARTGLEKTRTRLETASSARYVTADAHRQAREALGLHREQDRRKPQPPVIVNALMEGRLSSLTVSQGSTVNAGQPMAVIKPVLAQHFWINAYARPAEAAKFTAGQEFRLLFPGLSDFELTGKLESVTETPAPGALGVPVRLSLPDYDPLTMPKLAIGQPVEAKRK